MEVSSDRSGNHDDEDNTEKDSKACEAAHVRAGDLLNSEQRISGSSWELSIFLFRTLKNSAQRQAESSKMVVQVSDSADDAWRLLSRRGSTCK